MPASSGKSRSKKWVLDWLSVASLVLLAACAVFLLNRSISPRSGTLRNSAKDGMMEVYIPAGPFIMGGTEAEMLAECRKYREDCLEKFYTPMEPPHAVTLAGFWIDRTEVTNGMFSMCVRNGVCREPREAPLFGDEIYYGNPAYANYPVRNVTYADARAYCLWVGRRLPDEAQWEKAARGTDGRLYPWGNEPVTGNRANVCDKNCPRSYRDAKMDDGYVDTSPVGSYQAGASPYGVMDMAGNVREWTASLYEPYPYVPGGSRVDPLSTGNRVVRGSHWDGTADFSMSAYRFEDFPEYQSTCVGFRCVSPK